MVLITRTARSLTLGLGLLTAPALAQAPVVPPLTPAQLVQQFAIDFPSNALNQVSATQLRLDLGYIVNSMQYLLQPIQIGVLVPPQTLVATSKTYGVADFTKITKRSNNGSPMTDTFPASTLTGLQNGSVIWTDNIDASAGDMISAGAGTTINGMSSALLAAGRSVYWTYSNGTRNWSPELGGLVAVFGPASAIAGSPAIFADSTGKVLQNLPGACATLVPVAVTGAQFTYTANQNCALVQRSNAGSAMADAVPSATGTGVFPAGSFMCVENADTAGILVVGAAVGTSIQNGTFNGGVPLGPRQSSCFGSNGTGYVAIGAPTRAKLVANTTFYAAASGGNDSSPYAGLSASVPFATLQAWYNMLVQVYDLAGYTDYLQLADGNYLKGIIATAPIPGQSPVIFPLSGPVVKGNHTTPDNTVISLSGSDAAIELGGAAISINVQDLKITGTGTTIGLFTPAGSIGLCNVDFGPIGTWQIAIFNGNITDACGYTISGGGANHIYVFGNGYFAGGQPVTVTGTPAFSDAFVHVSGPSLIGLESPTPYTGAATGKRFIAENNGVIVTGSGTPCSATYFPGNVNGTTATGGQCN